MVEGPDIVRHIKDLLAIRKMKSSGILTREGGRFGGKWVITAPSAAGHQDRAQDGRIRDYDGLSVG